MRKSALAIGLVLSLQAHASLAQDRERTGPPGAGVIPIRLLQHESVQKELKLTPEQIQKLKVEQRKLRDRLVKEIEDGKRDPTKMFAESEKVVASVVTPEQMKRLKQITLQTQGAGALANADLAKELKLTAEQQKKLKVLHEDTTKKMKSVFEGGAESRQEARKKVAEITVQTQQKILEVLTGEQKTKWKEQVGAPFKGELRRGPPGGSDRG